MPLLRLIAEHGRTDEPWLLEWGHGTLTLTSPLGETVLEAPQSSAHRCVNLYELYAEEKVCLTTPKGSRTFRKDREALTAVRSLVEAGLAGDPDFRAELRAKSRRMIPEGLILFVICGGLFGLYCWLATWVPDPPPGHWIRWFGPVIHFILLILMASTFAGPAVAWHGFRQLQRIRRIEQSIDRNFLD